MKRNWKYDKPKFYGRIASLAMLYYFIAVVMVFTSCVNKGEDKYIENVKMPELDGLIQPVDEVVFSDVKTTMMLKKTISYSVNATGVISYDPQLLLNISSRFAGRIEKMYVSYNFENVSKGQRIMDIYSPEILTEQQNFIYLLKSNSNDVSMINSSKQKLQLLGLTDEQIQKVESSKQVINPIPVYSPYTGHIHDIGLANGISTSSGMGSGMGLSKSSSKAKSYEQIENLPSSQTSALSIKEGMYLQSGQPIFALYNTKTIWAVLNISPRDAAMVKVGDKVSITEETNPNNITIAKIDYIEPVISQNASSVKARVYIQNGNNQSLKIGTFINAKISMNEINGNWLPRKAVVALGQNNIVFVKKDHYFKSTAIKIGIMNDSLVQVTKGLDDNEIVASNAQFLVDSESFIQYDKR